MADWIRKNPKKAMPGDLKLVYEDICRELGVSCQQLRAAVGSHVLSLQLDNCMSEKSAQRRVSFKV
jgi:hypothetical protein